MDQVKDTLKKNTAILDPYAAMVPALVDISAKTGVNPGLILAGVGSIVMLVLLVLQGWTILLTTVTVLYPAVHSIRAIESETDEDDKVWLTYWMVFGVFNVLETFFGFIFYFIPYWDWIRLALFVWLLLPNFNGAKVIYDQVLQPLLKQNKDLIQEWIAKTSTAATDLQQAAKDEARKAATDPNVLAKGLEISSKVQSELNETEVKED